MCLIKGGSIIRKQFLMYKYLVLVFIFFSCKSKSDETKVAISFGIISTSLSETMPVQKKCFDRFSEVIDSLDIDPKKKVNIDELKTLVKNAYLANNVMIDLINKADEADTEIKLKEKALRYGKTLSSIYSNEFNECIILFGILDEDRYHKSAKILQPALNKFKIVSSEYDEALRRMVSKYNINLIGNVSN